MTTQKKLFIKPATDAEGHPYRVRLHDKPHMYLDPEGEWVVSHKHWYRRLSDGSVVEAKPPASPSAKSASKSAKE